MEEISSVVKRLWKPARLATSAKSGSLRVTDKSDIMTTYDR